MVDFDRVVVDVCASHMPALGAWEDPRLQVVHRDFFDAVREPGPGWDVILVDLVDQPLAQALAPQGLADLAAGLAPDGVVALSLGPAGTGELAGVHRVFPRAQAYSTWLESRGGRWAFAVSRAPRGPLAHTPDTWAGLTWTP